MPNTTHRPTLIICDRRRAGDWLLGSRPWTALDPHALDAADLAIWRAVGGAGQAWVGQASGWPGWRRLLVVDHADGSQFDLLQGLPDELTRAGTTACVALEGSGFHGLRGRTWEARRGNIHLSVALPLDTPARPLGPGLSIMPAVVVLDAVDQASGGRVSPGIKWVNDVLVDGAKVAGVLTASRVQGARVQLAVLGVGLNLEQAPRLAWTHFVPRSGCLSSLPGGRQITPRALLDAMLPAISRRMRVLLDGGPGELLEVYRQRALIMGRRVHIWEEGRLPPHPPMASGVVEAINDDLSLRLRGRPHPVTRGRLALASVLGV